jgi:hypothetical protein
VSLVGKGRIVTDERVEPSGARTTWHVVLFTDDSTQRELEVGRSLHHRHACAIKTRWEAVTCVMGIAPKKYSPTGLRGSKHKPSGRDPLACSRTRAAKKNPETPTPHD